MYQIQVNVIESETFETLVKSADCRVVAVVTVPQFGGYEDLVSRNATGFDSFADLFLVPVDFCRVYKAISTVNSIFYSVACRLSLWGLPRSQPKIRHLEPVVQSGS